jgi:hypothetical protein
MPVMPIRRGYDITHPDLHRSFTGLQFDGNKARTFAIMHGDCGT